MIYHSKERYLFFTNSLHVKIEPFHANIFFSCTLNSHHFGTSTIEGLEEKTWMIYCTNVIQFCVFLFIALPIELEKIFSQKS